jgi:hypothetical protein
MNTLVRRPFAPAWILAVGPLVAWASSAQAERTLRVPLEFPTISEAMEAAAPWDTVLVAPGNYVERVIVKDGVLLASELGAGETTISYDPAGQAETEAVITLQKCSNSTQVVGFTIDGGAEAKRGVLAIGDGDPVVAQCRIVGGANGVGCHRNASPHLVECVIEGSQVAGVFVQSGSADIRQCEILRGERVGLMIEGTTSPMTIRDTRIAGNVEVGIRASDGEFTMTGGTVTQNGNAGIILQYVSPVIEGVLVEGNANLGVALENCTATLIACTIRNNPFGVMISGTGEPDVSRFTSRTPFAVPVPPFRSVREASGLRPRGRQYRYPLSSIRVQRRGGRTGQ